MNESWLEKFEDYLNGKMNREEQMQFESEIASNEDLRDAFKLYQAIESEMSNQEKLSLQQAALKSSLGNLNNRYFIKDLESTSNEPAFNTSRGEELVGRVKKIHIWRSLTIAASITGLILLGAIWYRQGIKDNYDIAVDQRSADTLIDHSKKDTISKIIPSEAPQNDVKTSDEKLNGRHGPDQGKSRKDAGLDNKNSEDSEKLGTLFAKSFEPDTVPGRKAGPLQEAFHHYETGEYNDAIAALENVNLDVVVRGNKAGKKLETFYIHYYKGLSYLTTGQATKAIPALKIALAGSPDATSKAKAQWYLSLAYLRTGQSDQSEIFLNQLIRNQQSGIYYNKAVKLRDELTEHTLDQVDP